MFKRANSVNTILTCINVTQSLCIALDTVVFLSFIGNPFLWLLLVIFVNELISPPTFKQAFVLFFFSKLYQTSKQQNYVLTIQKATKMLLSHEHHLHDWNDFIVLVRFVFMNFPKCIKKFNINYTGICKSCCFYTHL